MKSQDHPLSQKQFKTIYSKVPRLTIEVLIKNQEGAVLLVKRAIAPCKGQWHLPGGTVYFGELLTDAVTRVARRELGITAQHATQNGYIEYPSHLDHSFDYPIGIVFEVTKYQGEVQLNHESADLGWFKQLPQDVHADQDAFLLNHGHLR